MAGRPCPPGGSLLSFVGAFSSNSLPFPESTRTTRAYREQLPRVKQSPLSRRRLRKTTLADRAARLLPRCVRGSVPSQHNHSFHDRADGLHRSPAERSPKTSSTPIDGRRRSSAPCSARRRPTHSRNDFRLAESPQGRRTTPDEACRSTGQFENATGTTTTDTAERHTTLLRNSKLAVRPRNPSTTDNDVGGERSWAVAPPVGQLSSHESSPSAADAPREAWRQI